VGRRDARAERSDDAPTLVRPAERRADREGASAGVQLGYGFDSAYKFGQYKF
jgi:hypothetical protein